MEYYLSSAGPPPKRSWALRLADRGTTLRLTWLLGALAVGLVAQRLTQAILDTFYARSGYPVPYYEGQLAFSAAKLTGWYTAMQRNGTLGVYWHTQFVDFGFILATGLLFTAVLLLVARAVPAGAARRLALTLVLLGPVVALLDVVENLISFVLLTSPTAVSEPLALIYSTAAALKFAGFLAVYTWAVAGLVTAAVLRLRRRRTGQPTGLSLAHCDRDRRESPPDPTP
jgi:hypothetical protein